MDYDKGGAFGGVPGDELKKILDWASSASTTVSELQDRIKVLVALVNEEHAAANPGNKVDFVSVVMKSLDVRTLHKDVIGGAAVGQLVTAIDELAQAWSKSY
jgi:hypothetical protein